VYVAVQTHDLERSFRDGPKRYLNYETTSPLRRVMVRRLKCIHFTFGFYTWLLLLTVWAYGMANQLVYSNLRVFGFPATAFPVIHSWTRSTFTKKKWINLFQKVHHDSLIPIVCVIYLNGKQSISITLNNCLMFAKQLLALGNGTVVGVFEADESNFLHTHNFF
jgi:hypothetical protein